MACGKLIVFPVRSAVECNWEEFFFRATVYGLWVAGEPYRVSSGYITKDTKVTDKR